MNPIEDSGEVNEAEKGLGELLVASADAAESFDTLEEVLDAMALAIETAVERKNLAASGLGGDADTDAKRIELSRELAGIKALVCDEAATSKQWQQRFDGELVVALTTVHDSRDQTTAQVNGGGLQSTLGFT